MQSVFLSLSRALMSLQRSPQLVSARDWMREIFLGVSEQDLLVDRARHVGAADDGTLFFCHVDGETLWRAGRFECPTVADLRQRVAEQRNLEQEHIPITVVDGVDIGRLQASLKTEDRALVQVASNFNALEVPSRGVPPDSGGLVTGYATDSTQGPAASFGVPGASLLRAHYAFHSDAAPSSAWGQTTERQVELLRDVREEYGRCVNGKTTLRRGSGGALREDGAAPVSALLSDRIRVCWHTDAEVVFDRGPSRVTLVLLPEGQRPLVDQVLSASVNLNDALNAPRSEEERESTRVLVAAALSAAYEGAYLAAALRGNRLLLLTLVGGGVFGNDEAAILDAIAQAHARWAPRSSLREVRLCLYQSGAAAAVDAGLRRRLEALGGRCAS